MWDYVDCQDLKTQSVVSKGEGEAMQAKLVSALTTEAKYTD